MALSRLTDRCGYSCWSGLFVVIGAVGRLLVVNPVRSRLAAAIVNKAEQGQRFMFPQAREHSGVIEHVNAK